jgi:hypothetical protein
MSYATVFKPGGDFYRVWSEAIDRLANGLQNVARKVFGCIVRKELAGTLATEKPTDAEIGQELGIAPRTVQKALHALDTDVLEVNGGQPLIDRESGLGCHGRRTIGLTVGLAPSGTRRPAEAAAPPQTPPELRGEFKNTTTRGGSSSSPESSEKEKEKIPDPSDPAIAALIDRACKLIAEATPGKVLDAVLVYGADWVSRALDVAEQRPRRKTGNKPVYSWGFVLATLKNWKREDGPPPAPPPRPPPPPKPAAEAPRPPQLLSAEQVAELVAACSEPGYPGRFNRIRLGVSIRKGEIGPELLATIPAELLAAPEVATPQSS